MRSLFVVFCDPSPQQLLAKADLGENYDDAGLRKLPGIWARLEWAGPLKMRVDSRTVAVAAAGVLLTVVLGVLAERAVGTAAGILTALVGLVGSAVVTAVMERQSRQAARAARMHELLEMFAPPRPLDDEEGEDWSRSRRPGSGVARYLRAEEQVVPFRARPELDELLAWCGAEGRMQVRLVTGEGGAGKTRLTLRLCRELSANGWQPLWVRPGIEVHAAEAVRKLGPCVLVVDYAETRDSLRSMLSDVVADTSAPDVRVLLLARGPSEWWQRLINNSEERVARLLAEPPLVIGPLQVEGGLSVLFDEALIAFANKLEVARPDARLMLADQEPVVLEVQAAALLAVLDHADGSGAAPARSATQVLDGLLGHEGRYWAQSAAARELDLDVAVQRLAVTIGCLIGADSETAAADLMRRVPDLAESAERRGRVARWLHDLYPESNPANAGAGEWIGPLRPDPVAEYLVVAELNNRPDLIPGLFTDLGEQRAIRALTVLARAAHTQEPALNLLRGALSADLENLAIPALPVAVETNPAVGKLLSEALQTSHISAGRLTQIASSIPYPSIALADPAAVVFKRLADNAANDGERAGWLISLSNRLGDLGQLEEALAATEQAVSLYRQLADDRPGEFLTHLAGSLNNQSARLAALKRPLEALAAIEEAAGIYRQLAEIDPDAFRPYLAMSLNNQSGYLAVLGRRKDALAVVEQATEIYRQLADTWPDAFPNLAKSLNNQALRLADLGKREQALAAVEQAVTIRRQLADARPDAFLPDFAESLNNQALRLAALGRLDEALTTIEQAVTIRRQLADARPDAFLPGLAESLRDQARCLGDLGQWGEALSKIEETVSLYRDLAQARPRLFALELAHSLDLMAAILSELERSEQSKDALTEAEFIRFTPEMRELLHQGLLIAAAYLRRDSAEQDRLIIPFLSEGRFSRLADAFTYVSLLAADVAASFQGRSFHEVLHSIDKRADVSLLAGLPTGPWNEALLLATAVKYGGDEEARRTPLTMDIPSAINVMFQLAISALTDLARTPKFTHMTPLDVSQMFIKAAEQIHTNG